MYIPQRKSQNAYSGLVYITSEKIGDVIKLSSAPSSLSFTIDKIPQGKIGISTTLGMYTILNKAGVAVRKRLRSWTSWFNVRDSANQQIEVIEIPVQASLFTTTQKRNVKFEQPASQPASQTASQTASAQIEHVPAPKYKVKPDMQQLLPFVAKQLFTFAKLTKEMCPITVEEFAEGHTAVMPCGHLFMQMAIEESFKIKKNQCPACRQAGVPFYV